MNSSVAPRSSAASDAREKIPVAPGAMPDPTAAPKPPRARILYAEDDAALRRTNQLILARAGYSVAAVADGAEAIRALHRDPYDLLITDNNMPRLSGMDLLRKMAADHIDIPAIMATGRVPEAAGAGFGEGARPCAMLVKPFTPQKLLALIEDILTKNGKGFSIRERAEI